MSLPLDNVQLGVSKHGNIYLQAKAPNDPEVTIETRQVDSEIIACLIEAAKRKYGLEDIEDKEFVLPVRRQGDNVAFDIVVRKAKR